MPKRLTAEGQELKMRLLSFKNFLKNADGDEWSKLIADNPSYFSDMLPYAIALGLDKKFMKQYESYRTVAPHWYRTDQNMTMTDIILLNHFFNHFHVADLKNTFVAPQSANSHSGGSISGGGFSGGGMGGGGGGSW